MYNLFMLISVASAAHAVGTLQGPGFVPCLVIYGVGIGGNIAVILLGKYICFFQGEAEGLFKDFYSCAILISWVSGVYALLELIEPLEFLGTFGLLFNLNIIIFSFSLYSLERKSSNENT